MLLAHTWTHCVSRITPGNQMTIVDTIADDINDTIRIQYRTGGSFSEQEVDTLIEQALADIDPATISYSEVNELIDYNLIEA